MRVRVKASATVCPGRVGVVGQPLPKANRMQAKARNGRWFVYLDRINKRNPASRIELFWGDELEPVEGVA